MKKTILFTFTLIMILTIFTACGGSGAITGSKDPFGLKQELKPGHYETNSDTITSDYFTLEFSFGETKNNNKTDIDTTISSFKRRLDALEVPYSAEFKTVTYSTSSSYDGIYVKIPNKNIGIPIFTLLATQRDEWFNIKSQYGDYKGYSFDLDFKTKSDGTYTIVSKWNKNADDYSNKLKKFAEAHVGEPLYLTANGMAISSMTITSDMEYDNLEFTGILFLGQDKISDNNRAVARLIKIVNDTKSKENMPAYITFGGAQLGDKDVYSTADLDMDFDVKYWTVTDEQKLSKAKNVYKDAMIYKRIPQSNAGGHIIVDIPVEKNGDMLMQFMETVRDVYNSCDFDDGSYYVIEFKNSKAGVTSIITFDKSNVKDGELLKYRMGSMTASEKEVANKITSEWDFFKNRTR